MIKSIAILCLFLLGCAETVTPPEKYIVIETPQSGGVVSFPDSINNFVTFKTNITDDSLSLTVSVENTVVFFKKDIRQNKYYFTIAPVTGDITTIKIGSQRYNVFDSVHVYLHNIH